MNYYNGAQLQIWSHFAVARTSDWVWFNVF